MLNNETVTSEILTILKAGTCAGKQYTLPPEHLERKVYEAVKEVLFRLGGKWNKKLEAHLFDEDPAPLLEWVFSGSMPLENTTDYFPTPRSLAEQLVSIPESAQRILEPSAGRGAIARVIRSYCQAHNLSAVLHCCEIVPAFADRLRDDGFTVVCENFLHWHPAEPYDGIFMNSPFALSTDQFAYITHIEHAWSMLAPFGVLRAIAPAGFTFRGDERIAAFRALVESHSSVETIEKGAFKESGTGIKTVILTLTKEAARAIQPARKKPALVAQPEPQPEKSFRQEMGERLAQLKQLQKESAKAEKVLQQTLALLLEEPKKEKKPVQQLGLWEDEHSA